MANQGAGDAVKLPDATQLAVDRTRLAHERTLMAWVRTATSMITFGFTIYKFFQLVHGDDKSAPPERLISSREFALLMILIGLVMLGLATLQHRQQLQRLRAQHVVVPSSLTMVLALLVVILGFAGFFTVIFRL